MTRSKTPVFRINFLNNRLISTDLLSNYWRAVGIVEVASWRFEMLVLGDGVQISTTCLYPLRELLSHLMPSRLYLFIPFLSTKSFKASKQNVLKQKNALTDHRTNIIATNVVWEQLINPISVYDFQIDFWMDIISTHFHKHKPTKVEKIALEWQAGVIFSLWVQKHQTKLGSSRDRFLHLDRGINYSASRTLSSYLYNRFCLNNKLYIRARATEQTFRARAIEQHTLFQSKSN